MSILVILGPQEAIFNFTSSLPSKSKFSYLACGGLSTDLSGPKLLHACINEYIGSYLVPISLELARQSLRSSIFENY